MILKQTLSCRKKLDGFLDPQYQLVLRGFGIVHAIKNFALNLIIRFVGTIYAHSRFIIKYYLDLVHLNSQLYDRLPLYLHFGNSHIFIIAKLTKKVK